MGGDEFCVLARCVPDRAERLLDDTSSALEDGGEGWHIGCSHGAAWIPSEAATESLALKLADDRMYANKAGRSSTSRQVSDALLQVITEQNASLDEHVERVSEMAGRLAAALGEPEAEVERIRLAAKLHDIGKTAIPAAILDKPGPLDDREWAFIHRHPGIGARIVSAAPALASTAPLINSSHERVDGLGYPDGLKDENIPFGSRNYRRLRRLRGNDHRPALPPGDRNRRGTGGTHPSCWDPVRRGGGQSVLRDRSAAPRVVGAAQPDGKRIIGPLLAAVHRHRLADLSPWPTGVEPRAGRAPKRARGRPRVSLSRARERVGR